MIISADWEEVGHRNFLELITKGKIEVYLNGKLQKNVTSINTETGLLVKYKLDDKGLVVLAGPANKPELLTETLYGVIKVEVDGIVQGFDDVPENNGEKQ